MDRPGPSQPQPTPLLAENPVKAVGRKVKSAFTSHQRPSVRILREPVTGRTVVVPVSGDVNEKVQPQLPLGAQAAEPEIDPELAERYAAQARAQLPQSTEKVYNGHFAGVRARAGAAYRSIFGHEKDEPEDVIGEDEYDADTVDLLDVVDPEVSTLSTLTNVQNSLFIPSLGGFFDRRPTYRLRDEHGEARTLEKLKSLLHVPTQVDEEEEGGPVGNEEEGRTDELEIQATRTQTQSRPYMERSSTITSTLSESRYAVLPHGESLDGWTPEEKAELDDLVRHKLHSRREKFKRAMRGFGQYVRRPLGLFVTVYATLITLFGAAWVLFLIGWISVGSKRDYVVNVVDNVLVALFAVIGDGLAPFRAVDTYHMAYIAYYHRKTWKRRAKLGLPDLVDHNDLPELRKEEVEPVQVDVESLIARRLPKRLARVIAPRVPKRLARRIVTRSGAMADASYEYSVLTEEEQAKLEFHERKFSKSHTFYKPHETETHYAFPLKLLVTVVLLLDMHSALQITLGACTWGIPYKTRPFALTTVVLCCSITCNIMGGVFISIGDRRTRKKDVIERIMRQQLTSEAMEQMQIRWMKEAEDQGELDKSVRKKFKSEKEEAENEEIKNAWKLVPTLPKRLLGKGVDHREPSLPQRARGAGPRGSPSSSGTFSPTESKSRNSRVLLPVQEDPTQSTQSVPFRQPALPPRPAATAQPPLPRPVVTRGQEPPQESTGQRILRFIRRADLDRS